MNAKQLRYYDIVRDRLVTASPSVLMVWDGQRPIKAIAGPHMLATKPRTVDDLRDAYSEWMEAGEPK